MPGGSTTSTRTSSTSVSSGGKLRETTGVLAEYKQVLESGVMAIDLSKMSTQELLVMRGAVGCELDSRGVEYSALVKVGGKEVECYDPTYALAARKMIREAYTPVARECGLRLVGCYTRRGGGNAHLLLETQTHSEREGVSESLRHFTTHPSMAELGRRTRDVMAHTSSAYVYKYMEDLGLEMEHIWTLMIMQNEGVPTDEAVRRIKARESAWEDGCSPDVDRKDDEREGEDAYVPPLIPPSPVLEHRKRVTKSTE